eukprot:TRINITY_DN3096_c0_g1_i1.p1 TRINITY_DN3096_c0_g1~~TRINITY_DN3096_c0_g1_i1.p1  ORF type:complete len:1215 (+),score=197.38 TRINITY_DN3096_c0_g1_i1:126-3647(+)
MLAFFTQRGRVLLRRAYASLDGANSSPLRRDLAELSFEICEAIPVPATPTLSVLDPAAMRQATVLDSALDVFEIVMARPFLDVVVLATGDVALLPLMQKMRQWNKHVVAVLPDDLFSLQSAESAQVQSAMLKLLRRHCDEVLVFDSSNTGTPFPMATHSFTVPLPLVTLPTPAAVPFVPPSHTPPTPNPTPSSQSTQQGQQQPIQQQQPTQQAAQPQQVQQQVAHQAAQQPAHQHQHIQHPQALVQQQLQRTASADGMTSPMVSPKVVLTKHATVTPIITGLPPGSVSSSPANSVKTNSSVGSSPPLAVPSSPALAQAPLSPSGTAPSPAPTPAPAPAPAPAPSVSTAPAPAPVAVLPSQSVASLAPAMTSMSLASVTTNLGAAAMHQQHAFKRDRQSTQLRVALGTLIRALQLCESEGYQAFFSIAKSYMVRIDPPFNEKLLGFPTFKSFLQYAVHEGAVRFLSHPFGELVALTESSIAALAQSPDLNLDQPPILPHPTPSAGQHQKGYFGDFSGEGEQREDHRPVKTAISAMAAPFMPRSLTPPLGPSAQSTHTGQSTHGGQIHGGSSHPIETAPEMEAPSLTGQVSSGPVTSEQRESMRSATASFLNAARAVKESGRPPTLSLVKSQMLRHNPHFSQTAVGFVTFKDFASYICNEGFTRMTQGPSGDSVVLVSDSAFLRLSTASLPLHQPQQQQQPQGQLRSYESVAQNTGSFAPQSHVSQFQPSYGGGYSAQYMDQYAQAPGMVHLSQTYHRGQGAGVDSTRDGWLTRVRMSLRVRRWSILPPNAELQISFEEQTFSTLQQAAGIGIARSVFCKKLLEFLSQHYDGIVSKVQARGWIQMVNIACCTVERIDVASGGDGYDSQPDSPSGAGMYGSFEYGGSHGGPGSAQSQPSQYLLRLRPEIRSIEAFRNALDTAVIYFVQKGSPHSHPSRWFWQLLVRSLQLPDDAKRVNRLITFLASINWGLAVGRNATSSQPQSDVLAAPIGALHDGSVQFLEGAGIPYNPADYIGIGAGTSDPAWKSAVIGYVRAQSPVSREESPDVSPHSALKSQGRVPSFLLSPMDGVKDIPRELIDDSPGGADGGPSSASTPFGSVPTPFAQFAKDMTVRSPITHQLRSMNAEQLSPRSQRPIGPASSAVQNPFAQPQPFRSGIGSFTSAATSVGLSEEDGR